jgi:hypothetical protein
MSVGMAFGGLRRRHASLDETVNIWDGCYRVTYVNTMVFMN